MALGLVYARQDDDAVAPLLEALEAEGVKVVRHRITGLPGRTVEHDRRVFSGDETPVLVLFTPWLRCSDWPFSDEARSIVGSGRGVVVQLSDAPCQHFAASPLASCETLAPLREDGSALSNLVRALRRRNEGQQPKRSRRADPGEAPAIQSAQVAMLAERLEGLYAVAARRSGVRGLQTQIDRTLEALQHGPALEPGTYLGQGRYRLFKHVSNGPTAAIWRGWDRLNDRLVAVRVLHAQWSERASAFLEGARRAASIDHPAVAPLRDPGGVERGHTYVVRDWYEKGGLEQAVESGELTALDALQATLDAADALVAVHRAERAHGNIKPSNILIASDLRGYIADFEGFEPRDPIFAAPEVQEDGYASIAADVYSLAMCVLFALHGDALPFWVLRDPGKLIRSIRLPSGSPLPEAARLALLGALDWRVEQRTPTIQAFLSGFFEDRRVLDALRENAERSGRHEAAAAHVERLLDRTEGRPLPMVLSLGQTWAAAVPRVPSARERAWALLIEVVERTTDRQELDLAVAALRSLIAQRDDAQRLIDTFLDLDDDRPIAVDRLVHVARLQLDELQDPALAAVSWERLVERHLHRAQAAEAHHHLVQVAYQDVDRQAFFDLGTRAFPYLDEATQRQLAFDLGVAAQDDLEDLPEALRWLEKAQALGYPADQTAPRLESIRSARGEWRQVVALMLERAEALEEQEAVDLLVRAARVAVHAHNHHDEAAAILLRVLLVDPEHREALRFLARYHARSGRDDRALALYARLAPHEERAREGETVSTRVADNVDYARVLLRCDRPRGAQLCLEAALDLNPSHVPTLELTGQLAYDLGKWDEARVANEGLVRAFGSATPEPVLVNACVRLGDIAWLHGDLFEAVRHYNAALELASHDPRVWWGRAKVALAGLLGRLSEAHKAEEPWLLAAPVRFTAEEALARLLAVLIRPEALTTWFELDPMGREIASLMEGQPQLVRICAAVDLLRERGLVDITFFDRLQALHPGWSGPIQQVRRLWLDPEGAAGFDVAATYRWPEEPGTDFDGNHHREALAPLSRDTPARRPSLASLGDASAWERLFTGAHLARRRPPEVPVPSKRATVVDTGIVELFPQTPDRRTARIDRSVTIGSGVHDELSAVAPGLRPAHAVVERVGDCFYVRGEQGVVTVDGNEVAELRLFGGERFHLGAAACLFRIVTPAVDATPPVVVQRPTVELKEPTDLLQERNERAALFYREGLSDRIIPLASETLILWEDDDGELRTRPGTPGLSDFGLTLEAGAFLFHEPDAEPRRLEHRDEMVIGRRVLQFKELARQGSAPLADIAALWGAPENAPILVYDDGSRHGRPLVLDRSTYRIGRGRQADFQISFDSSLSRTHCILTVRGDRVTVRDAGSANGTLVNGEPIEAEHTLKEGDTILIGQSRFHFRPTPAGDTLSIDSPLEDFGTDESTDVLPVSERIRLPLGLDEGLEKIRVANKALRIALDALDEARGPDRGVALLETMVAARPRSYHNLLEGIDVRSKALPGLEVMFNVAQRPDSEQRPLLNHVLLDVIERAVETVCTELPEERLESTLVEIAATRYRDFLRI